MIKFTVIYQSWSPKHGWIELQLLYPLFHFGLKFFPDFHRQRLYAWQESWGCHKLRKKEWKCGISGVWDATASTRTSKKEGKIAWQKARGCSHRSSHCSLGRRGTSKFKIEILISQKQVGKCMQISRRVEPRHCLQGWECQFWNQLMV